VEVVPEDVAERAGLEYIGILPRELLGLPRRMKSWTEIIVNEVSPKMSPSEMPA